MSPWTAKLRQLQTKGTCIFIRGLEQRRIQHRTGSSVWQVQALIEWSEEGQHHHSILHPNGGLNSCRTQRCIAMYIPWGTRTLPQCCTTVSWLLLPGLWIPSLMINNCWDLSRASIAARIWLRNGFLKFFWSLRPKWVLLCQESHAWFFPQDSLTHLLTKKTWIEIFPKMIYKWATGIGKYAQNHSSVGKWKSKLQWDITSCLLE